jgi:hypothetical protein
MTWFGWLRRDRRHRWQRACGPCASLAQCSRLLGDEAQRQGVLDRNTCMTTGSYPRDVQAGIDGERATITQNAPAGAETTAEPLAEDASP